MSLFFTMCLYSISMSLSPGPVNLLTFASGVNFGLRRTLPFVSGATIGFILLLFLVGVGFNQLLPGQNPAIKQWMTVLACLFISYLGYKIFNAEVEVSGEADNAPGFVSGFLLQWLNPKAWLASVAGVSAFDLSGSLQALLGFVIIYFICCYVCICLWAAAGQSMSQVVRQRGYLKKLNYTTGVLLILIALYLLAEALF